MDPAFTRRALYQLLTSLTHPRTHWAHIAHENGGRGGRKKVRLTCYSFTNKRELVARASEKGVKSKNLKLIDDIFDTCFEYLEVLIYHLAFQNLAHSKRFLSNLLRWIQFRLF